MTTFLDDYANIRYSTSYGDFYNGVAKVSNGTNYGTGALLYDGRSIITAAHIFSGYDTRNITVYFDTYLGAPLAYSAYVSIYEGYDSQNANGDIAILTLEQNASADYRRYDIYRYDDEIGQDFTMAGYGMIGSGSGGALEDTSGEQKLKTSNTFDTDMYSVSLNPSSALSWTPQKDAVLAADFDDGSSSHDTFGAFLGIADTGVGYMEGLIAPGDSGGPAFIDEAIAGIASYTSYLATYHTRTDIDDVQNSSFGEIGAWQRASYYQEWIDKTLRSNYENAPMAKEEVQKTVYETDSDIVYTYFLLEFVGDRDGIDADITVDYSTRDGSAVAGWDYIAVSGTIAIYRDESKVVIPVEIIPDDITEGEEYFYMDVTNPSHGSFGEGVVMLTAVRTILDDDMV